MQAHPMKNFTNFFGEQNAKKTGALIMYSGMLEKQSPQSSYQTLQSHASSKCEIKIYFTYFSTRISSWSIKFPLFSDARSADYTTHMFSVEINEERKTNDIYIIVHNIMYRRKYFHKYVKYCTIRYRYRTRIY